MKKTMYTNEFKQEDVKLCISGPKSTSQVSEDLGIKKATLYSWVNLAMKNKLPENYKVIENPRHRAKELELENVRLQKALKRAEMERDILKKAAAYFASQGM